MSNTRSSEYIPVIRIEIAEIVNGLSQAIKLSPGEQLICAYSMVIPNPAVISFDGARHQNTTDIDGRWAPVLDSTNNNVNLTSAGNVITNRFYILEADKFRHLPPTFRLTSNDLTQQQFIRLYIRSGITRASSRGLDEIDYEFIGRDL